MDDYTPVLEAWKRATSEEKWVLAMHASFAIACEKKDPLAFLAIAQEIRKAEGSEFCFERATERLDGRDSPIWLRWFHGDGYEEETSDG